MTQQVITISGITGGVPPFTFYICDENGNNCSVLATTGGTYTASTFYETATTLMIKVIDSVGCIVFKIVSCPEDTYFILTEDSLIMITEDGDGLIWI